MFKRDPPVRPIRVLTAEEHTRLIHFVRLLITVDKRLQRKDKSKKKSKTKNQLQIIRLIIKRALFLLITALYLSYLHKQLKSNWYDRHRYYNPIQRRISDHQS